MTVVDGILISHAGISGAYDELWDEVDHDPERLAAQLNGLFSQAVRQELETGEWDDDGILADKGPLWFRPYEYNELQPLAGVTQVVGHTPPIEKLEDEGFFMVDPCAHWGGGAAYRYAVIEGGRVRVERGTLEGPLVSPPSPRASARV